MLWEYIGSCSSWGGWIGKSRPILHHPESFLVPCLYFVLCGLVDLELDFFFLRFLNRSTALKNGTNYFRVVCPPQAWVGAALLARQVIVDRMKTWGAASYTPPEEGPTGATPNHSSDRAYDVSDRDFNAMAFGFLLASVFFLVLSICLWRSNKARRSSGVEREEGQDRLHEA